MRGQLVAVAPGTLALGQGSVRQGGGGQDTTADATDRTFDVAQERDPEVEQAFTPRGHPRVLIGDHTRPVAPRHQAGQSEQRWLSRCR
jgi:hypothetical protein